MSLSDSWLELMHRCHIKRSEREQKTPFTLEEYKQMVRSLFRADGNEGLEEI
jgi:hypothetical protein